MINRRYLFSLLAVALLSFAATAQQINFGVEAGPSSSRYGISGTDTAGADALPLARQLRQMNYTVGGMVQLSMGGHYHLQSGLSLFRSGGVFENDTMRHVVRFNYLQIPLYIMFTSAADHGFLCGFGIHYNYAITGTYTHINTAAGRTTTEPIPFGTYHNFPRTQLGATPVLLGYRLRNGFFARVCFFDTLVPKNIGGDWTYGSGGITLTLGYLFH